MSEYTKYDLELVGYLGLGQQACNRYSPSRVRAQEGIYVEEPRHCNCVFKVLTVIGRLTQGQDAGGSQADATAGTAATAGDAGDACAAGGPDDAGTAVAAPASDGPPAGHASIALQAGDVGIAAARQGPADSQAARPYGMCTMSERCYLQLSTQLNLTRASKVYCCSSGVDEFSMA